jgi:hypothetical protein
LRSHRYQRSAKFLPLRIPGACLLR